MLGPISTLFMVIFIIIIMMIYMRYQKIYSVPNCGVRIGLIRKWNTVVVILREMAVRKYNRIQYNGLYEDALKYGEGIALLLDDIYRGSYYELRQLFHNYIKHMKDFIEKGDGLDDMFKNARYLGLTISKLNRQYDKDVLEEKFITHNKYLVDEFKMIKEGGISLIEFNLLLDNIYDTIDYLLDPPKRWSVKFFDLE